MQNFISGDSQIPTAHSKYADPAMESLLLSLHPLMEKHTGLSLYPTYSYYRVYRPGANLLKHKDRSACEISCTVCFNYDYDDSNYNWPIYMEDTKVVQKPGDLVIYRGCELSHWRDPFDYGKDCWQVQGFFHYVDANGEFADEKWDRRESIGLMREGCNQGFYPGNQQTSDANNSLPSYIIYTE